jgi:hypothetical protein
MRSSLFVLALSLVSLAACGDGGGSSDSGPSGLDAPIGAPDAPGPDAPGLDAPGLDAPTPTGDAPVPTDDAGATDDAPSPADDAPAPAEDAFAGADAPANDDAASTGSFCGGIGGIACRDPAQYCNYDCTVPDGAGTCEPRPDFCADVLDPVCGCDGVTYSNPCMAAMAGVPVRTRGRCAGTADCRVDGCGMGLECCGTGRRAGSCYDPRCLSCCM